MLCIGSKLHMWQCVEILNLCQVAKKWKIKTTKITTNILKNENCDTIILTSPAYILRYTHQLIIWFQLILPNNPRLWCCHWPSKTWDFFHCLFGVICCKPLVVFVLARFVLTLAPTDVYYQSLSVLCRWCCGGGELCNQQLSG